MGVRAADHAELVRVRSELRFEGEAVLQRFAGVLVLQHAGLLCDAAVEVSLVPELEVGKRVVRRKHRVRLARPLHLGHLVDRLPLRALLRILGVERPAEGGVHGEHRAVGEIAVVRDRQHAAAGLLLVGVHPRPQVDRVVAPGRPEHRERLNQSGPVPTVTEDHVAVQVVASRVRRPFVADEGGEGAGVVEFLGCVDGLLPGVLEPSAAGEEGERLGKRVVGECDDDLERRRLAVTLLDQFVPAPPGGIGQHRRRARQQGREEPHVVRVVGDHEEVKRARQLHGLAGVRRHLLPTGEAIRVAWVEARAEGAGVHRKRRVEVSVAKEGAGREIAVCVRGVRTLAEAEGELLRRCCSGDADVLPRLGGVLRVAWRSKHSSDRHRCRHIEMVPQRSHSPPPSFSSLGL